MPGPRNPPVDAVGSAKHGVGVLEEGVLEHVVGACAHELNIFEIWCLLLSGGKSQKCDDDGDVLPFLERKRRLGCIEFFSVMGDLEIGKTSLESVEGRGFGINGSDDEKLVALQGLVEIHDQAVLCQGPK